MNYQNSLYDAASWLTNCKYDVQTEELWSHKTLMSQFTQLFRVPIVYKSFILLLL